MSLRPSFTLKGHSTQVHAVAEVGVQGTIHTASEDGTVNVWSLSEARCIDTFSNIENISGEPMTFVDGSTVIARSGRTVKVVRVTDGSILAELSSLPNYVWSCAVLGVRTAVVGDEAGMLFKVEWNTDTGTIDIVERKFAHLENIFHIASRGNKFVTSSWDNTAKLWDAGYNSLTLIHTFPIGLALSGCRVAFNDEYLVTSIQENDTGIQVYDVRTSNRLAVIETNASRIRFLYLVQKNNIVVSSEDNNVIALYSLPFGECVAKYNIGMTVYSMTVLQWGMLGVLASDSNDINIFKINQLRERNIREKPDLLALVKRQVECEFEKYSTSQEAQLASAVERIANLEQSLLRVKNVLESFGTRIVNIESSLQRLTDAKEEADQCCVCLEPFRVNDNVFRLPCFHVHHTACLFDSLKQMNEPKCPICRTIVSAADIDNLPKWKWKL